MSGSGSGSGDAPGWELITPAEIEDVVIDVLRRRHGEHLAAQERRHGLQADTLERLNVSHLMAQDERTAEVPLPSALVGWAGTASEPTRNEDQALDVTHLFALEVTVGGNRRRDTLRKRDWLGWVAIETILQRTPRSGFIDTVRLRDVEPVEYERGGGLIGVTRALFEVWIPSAVSLNGLAADDDGRWPPADTDWVATDIAADTRRLPIT